MDTLEEESSHPKRGRGCQYQVAPDSSLAIFTSEDLEVRFTLTSVVCEPAALASLESLLEAQNLSCHSIPVESKSAFVQIFR